ncbi:MULTISPECIES: winged helix-turn-helix domain-containing protein [Vibrio]|uniref:OmpR/PhoB-type domain-containing protein n=1 Tax=Vibrio mediterranei TaxID=689 RepID=A0ABX5DB61_9VIBR|nr:hypothetical protein HW45_06925 [Vibrio sp. ER1A]NOH26841.1 hypothetical protein [Vibrio mediterranei]NOI23039.1 hypothetical protein [Vibrio mediterranei]PCD86321.1 hypothetical protein COR52_21920 [Vibrio mediterranei]PRQ66122.1 hypothetical protein COR51_18580 [Vibrio mediterranei]
MECLKSLECFNCIRIKNIECRFDLQLEKRKNKVIDRKSNRVWSETCLRMLCCLNQTPQGVVLSKNEIVDFVWDGEPISESSLLQLVYCTRRNLADKNIRIISIRGVGYALVEGENAIYVCAN